MTTCFLLGLERVGRSGVADGRRTRKPLWKPGDVVDRVDRVDSWRGGEKFRDGFQRLCGKCIWLWKCGHAGLGILALGWLGRVAVARFAGKFRLLLGRDGVGVLT